MPGPLTVTRLLQNPLGDHAPDGERGDIVRVSDGTATVYLTPSEYEQASLAQLRCLLVAREPRRRTS
jgi:ribosomal protein L9